MMMPFTYGMSIHDTIDEKTTQSSPELRRMNMYSNARRAEIDALLHNVDPRHTVAYGQESGEKTQKSGTTKVFNRVRSGIGNALITAGNRIQSPA